MVRKNFAHRKKQAKRHFQWQQQTSMATQSTRLPDVDKSSKIQHPRQHPARQPNGMVTIPFDRYR